jgi:hypothetical protein
MLEEFYYLDPNIIKVTAASVGISSKRWTGIKENQIENDNYKLIMLNNHFDILPIISNSDNVKEFFKSDIPNKYERIARCQIYYNDIIPLETPIREVIKGFSTEKRIFYFLTFQDRVSGLITLSNLNSRGVYVFIYKQICELEKELGNFIQKTIEKSKIEKYVQDRLPNIWEDYQVLITQDLENNIIELLYLKDFFNIINHFKIFNLLNYSKKEWENLNSINELRNPIAHPNRNLLNKKNDIDALWRRINRLGELMFRINQLKLN